MYSLSNNNIHAFEYEYSNFIQLSPEVSYRTCKIMQILTEYERIQKAISWLFTIDPSGISLEDRESLKKRIELSNEWISGKKIIGHRTDIRILQHDN